MKKLLKWIAYVVGAFVVLVVVAGVIGGKSGSPAAPAGGGTGASSGAAETAKPSPPLPAPAVSTSVAALYTDYETNEVSADQKYKGKLLAMTGSVQSIDKDAFNNIAVQLKTSNEFMPAHAYLGREHESLAASLKKGQKIAWKCTGGGRVIGSPVLRDCQPGQS